MDFTVGATKRHSRPPSLSAVLRKEAKPNNPGCKGLPAASWSVVLIFNTAEQCLAARQYLEKARLELLDKRGKLVTQILAEEGGERGGEEALKVEEVQPEPVVAPETDAPPIEAPTAAALEGDDGAGD